MSSGVAERSALPCALRGEDEGLGRALCPAAEEKGRKLDVEWRKVRAGIAVLMDGNAGACEYGGSRRRAKQWLSVEFGRGGGT